MKLFGVALVSIGAISMLIGTGVFWVGKWCAMPVKTNWSIHLGQHMVGVAKTDKGDDYYTFPWMITLAGYDWEDWRKRFHVRRSLRFSACSDHDLVPFYAYSAKPPPSTS